MENASTNSQDWKTGLKTESVLLMQIRKISLAIYEIYVGYSYAATFVSILFDKA